MASGSENAPEPARVTAVDAAGRYVVPGVPADRSRIVAPGAPERSALLHRMRSRRPSSQMPPIGTAIADEEAAELVRRWIENLRTPAPRSETPHGGRPPAGCPPGKGAAHDLWKVSGEPEWVHIRSIRYGFSHVLEVQTPAATLCRGGG